MLRRYYYCGEIFGAKAPLFNAQDYKSRPTYKILVYLFILTLLILLTMALPNARPEDKISDTKFVSKLNLGEARQSF